MQCEIENGIEVAAVEEKGSSESAAFFTAIRVSCSLSYVRRTTRSLSTKNMMSRNSIRFGTISQTPHAQKRRQGQQNTAFAGS